MVHWDLQVLLDHLVHLVIEEFLAFLVQQDPLEEEDLLVHKVKEESLGLLVKRDHLVHLDLKALQAPLGLEESGVSRVQLERMVHLVLEGLVTRVPLELLDLLVALDLQDYQAPLVKVVLQGILEREEKGDPMGLLD